MKRAVVVAVGLLAACAGSGAPASNGGTPRQPPPEPIEAPIDRIAAAPVYDATGAQLSCEPPREACGKLENAPDFLDRCRIGGWQVRRCGCKDMCSGKVEMHPQYWDESGAQQACEKEAPDCTAPETSAKFQDACADAGHKLVVCGCAWLCTGEPKH